MSNDDKTDSKMISGYIMAIIGFAFLILNALNYIMNWKLKLPSVVLGIVFLVIGMGWVRTMKKKKDMGSKGNKSDVEKENLP